jgi:hypothetical protein
MSENITKRELCALFEISYNTIQQQFSNGLSTPPLPVGKQGKSEFLYEKEEAIKWVELFLSADFNKKSKPIKPKLMNLNVKWGKPRETIQKLDNIEKVFFGIR